MKTVIKHRNGQIPRSEILENINANDGVCYIELKCDWEAATYEYLNELLDDAGDNTLYLCDVSYKAKKLDVANGEILFEACAIDCEDYINECEGEDAVLNRREYV